MRRLSPYERAPLDDEQGQESIAVLLKAAEPAIDTVLTKKLASCGLNDRETREDLKSEVLLRLLDRLHGGGDAAATPITSFRDYAAVVAFHVFDDFLRSKFPMRARLKNRVRYLAGHHQQLAIWTIDARLVVGRAEWRLRPFVSAPAGGRSAASGDLAEVMLSLLDGARGPLALDDLVDLVGEATGELDTAPPPRSDDDDQLDAAWRAPEEQLDATAFLRQLWSEIRALPPRQRIALLMNLRDASGESVIHFLPLLGIAPM